MTIQVADAGGLSSRDKIEIGRARLCRAVTRSRWGSTESHPTMGVGVAPNNWNRGSGLRRQIRSCQLMNLFACWNLSRHEKSFHQFIFTTHNHPWKLLEPFPVWDFRLRVQPFDHQGKLVSRYVSLLDAFQQMRIQLSGQIAAENFLHELPAVKSPGHGRLQPDNFGGIVRCGQSVGQFTQFLAGELAILSQSDSELNHFGLFRRRQLFDFLDDRG